MTTFQTSLVIIIIAAAAILFFTLFRRPIRFILKVLFNILLGFVALILINMFGAFIGITIGVNWINAVVVALLGLPGVILLIVLQWIL